MSENTAPSPDGHFAETVWALDEAITAVEYKGEESDVEQLETALDDLRRMAGCPTCGSDDREWRKPVFDEEGVGQGDCDDPWHNPDLERCPDCDSPYRERRQQAVIRASHSERTGTHIVYGECENPWHDHGTGTVHNPDPDPSEGEGLRAEPMASEARRIAQAFHEIYERRAPAYNYKTREESAVPWEEVPPANRSLMVSTVHELLSTGVLPLSPDPLGADLRGEIERWLALNEKSEHPNGPPLSEAAKEWVRGFNFCREGMLRLLARHESKALAHALELIEKYGTDEGSLIVGRALCDPAMMLDPDAFRLTRGMDDAQIKAMAERRREARAKAKRVLVQIAEEQRR